MLQFKCFRGKHGVRALCQDQGHGQGQNQARGKKEKEMKPADGGINLRGITSRSLVQRHATFRGTCCLCQYPAHSQMFCPLRLCRVCKRFGHSEAVCTHLTGEAIAVDDEEAEEDAIAEWD